MTSPDPSDAAVTEPPDPMVAVLASAMAMAHGRSGSWLWLSEARHLTLALADAGYELRSALPSTPVRPTQVLDQKRWSEEEPYRKGWSDGLASGRGATPVRPDPLRNAAKTVAFAMETHHQGAPAFLLREWSGILRAALRAEQVEPPDPTLDT